MAAPRKRAASAPKPKPEPEGLDALSKDAPEGVADAGDAEADQSLGEPEPAKASDPDAEQPCTECFPAGWPDGATSVGCSHDTWNREL